MSQDSLFRKLYVSNLKNRLHEIDNPTEEDKIRWPMELIQNAKDSLYLTSNEQKQKCVSITIEIKGNPNNITEVIFSHDGPPFTQDSYEGLMYKISQGKDNNKKTAGKFGTGFLTTHVLSKTVYISGDIVEEDNKITGFSVTMYREGKTDEEILSNYKKMRKSFEPKPDRLNLTTFRYETNTAQSKQCAKLGVINLKNHISYVLINCPDIKSITLIENGKETLYSASKSIENSILYMVTASNKKEEKTQNFLKISQKKVDITVEIDDKYNIVPKGENIECLYAVFPLIGTGSHILPFSINSSQFEPSTERNNLPLQGEIEEVSNNKKLLLNSMDLYKKLIDQLQNNNCNNMHELARGLKLDKCPYKCFDLAWYEEKFLQPMRDILSEKVTVKSCSNEPILLSDVYFPCEINNDAIKKFLKLSVIKKYYPNMIEYEDFMLWKDYIWKTPRMVSVNSLLEIVQKDNSLFDEPQLNSFNEILSFIWEYDKNLLHNQALIPNMNNELKRFSIDGVFIRECKKVSDEIIQIIEDIKIPWKSTHVNNLVNSIKFDEDDETDAEKKIADEFLKLIDTHKNEELQNISYCLMKFVIKDDEKREKMFQIASKIDDFPYKNTDIIHISKVNPIIWKHADDFVLKKIIENIQKFDSDSIKSNLDYVKEFIYVFKLHYKFEPDFINSTKVIPNAKNELKCLNDLFNQSAEFHNHFSPKINEFFNIDLDDRIINPEINQIIQSDKDEKITDFLGIIDENINVDEFERFLPIAELVLSVIPSKNQQQREIFNIYKRFKPSINEILIDDDSFNFKYYDKPNKIILSKLCQFAEESGSLQNFQKNYSLSEEEAFNSLNLIYSKFEECTSDHAIIPNKEGKFMVKKELRIDPKIDENVFDLFIKLDQNSEMVEEHQLNSPEKIVHPNVKIDGIENFDIDGFYKTLNKKIRTVVSNPNVSRKIKQMINDYIEIDFINVKGGSMSDDQKAKMGILHNAHIAFIKNRVRELSDPKPSDFQRWPFELIQNATDCIQDSSEKKFNEAKNGHIVFIFNDNEVIFKHYGAPFTHRNLNSLLYQYGGEKEGKSKIGKFGTGFLSTMILTRKVVVTSDLLTDDGSVKGFNVTIDRSGETTEELKNYIGLMEDSLNTELEKTGKTQFVFKLPIDKEENKNCYKAYNEGLKSLVKYIAPSLIFNPKIKSIKVKTKTTCHVYALEEDDAKEEDDDTEINSIKQIVITNKLNNKLRHRQFIYSSSKKSFNDKNIKVECLLEVGSKQNNIIASEEFLFLQFPIFGRKEFRSPIIINSPNFEPETERNDIIINNRELKETSGAELKDKDETDDTDDSLTSINKFIISESVNLFKSIINSARNLDCIDLFNICYGLKNDSCNTFYQKNFIEKIRSIILKSNVFECSPGVYKKCKFVIIPYIEFGDFAGKDEEIESDVKKDLYENYYDLVSRLNYESKSLMDYTLCLNWLNLLWPDFKHRFDIQQFLGYISEYEDVDTLPLKKKDSISKKELYRKKELFFSELIRFILKMKKIDNSMIFGKNKVFLNKNKRLVPLAEIYQFNWNNEARNVIFDLMDIVNYDYKSNMLSDGLKHVYNRIKFDEFSIEKAIHAIEDRINEENSINFMKYIIQDNDKRKLMYKFSEKLLEDTPAKVEISMKIFKSTNHECNIDNIINSMFRKADEFITEKLISKIQDINVKDNIDFLYDFVKLCKETMPSTKLEIYKIVPNKNFKLCNYRELSKDCLDNEKLKKILKKTLNLDLNEELVHEKFNEFIDKQMNLNDASSKILDSINGQGEDFYKEDKCDLFKIIMQHSIDEDYKVILLRIFNFFYQNEKVSFNSEKEQYFSFNLTKKIIELILYDVSKCISLFDNIQEFAYQFKKCSSIYDIFTFDISKKKYCETNLNLIFIYLSDVYYLLLKYDLLKADEHKIFPNNYNGDLLFLRDIKIIYDFQIEKDILFELLNYLIIFSDSNEIQKTILNREIPVKKDFEKMLKDNMIDLIWLVNKIDENFPQLAGNGGPYSESHDSFIKFVYKYPKLRAAFADLLERIKECIPRGIIENLNLIDFFVGDESRLKFLREYYQSEIEKNKQKQIIKPPDPELKPLYPSPRTPNLGQHKSDSEPKQLDLEPKTPDSGPKILNKNQLKPGSIIKPNSRPSTPHLMAETPLSKQVSPNSDFKSKLAPLEPIDTIEKYKKQATLYEKLKANCKYSNVSWPIKSDSKTDVSFTYKDKIYYLDLSCDKSNDYDISASYQGETIYFKVQQYFPYFMKEKNQKNDGKNIVSSYVDDENDEVLYLNNLD